MRGNQLAIMTAGAAIGIGVPAMEAPVAEASLNQSAALTQEYSPLASSFAAFTGREATIHAAADPSNGNCQTVVKPIQNGTLTTTTCDTITFRIGSTEVSKHDVDNQTLKVLSNIGTKWSAKRIKAAEQAGNCMTVGDGTKHKWFLNQGWNTGNSKTFGMDHRRSEICKQNGHWVRVACSNEVKLIPVQPKTPPIPALFVNNAANATLKVSAKSSSHSKAEVRCGDDLNYSYAEADGSGSGSASGSLTVRDEIRTHGAGGNNISGQITASANLSAESASDSQALAAVECAQTPPPLQFDVCQNIPGNQPQVPAGEVIDKNGNCSTPPSETLVSVQEVDVNSFNVVQANITAPQGDTLQACFSAVDGRFNTPCVQVTAGTQPVPAQNTYIAPSQVETDTMTETTTDLDTGLSSSASENISVITAGSRP